ncbi:MAG TPA: hypothetical protein VFP59_02490 [Candidatus Angelobacter sp.]|nr:hypothetical protein [Candidatus Angelobacter sp.]
MTPFAPASNLEIEHILESAVILSWSELVSRSEPAMIHVEYATAPEPCLQYLKIWQSGKRGKWDLICEYWISAGSAGDPKIGLTFCASYHSPRLTEILGNVLQHQKSIPDALSGETKLNLIVIAFPTPEEKQSAIRCISQAYRERGLSFAATQGTRLNHDAA